MDILELYYIILWGVFGTILGSFANVVIYRLPRGKSVLFPPSACGSCDTPIKWYDNIPIFSYIILGGKCRHCKAHYSARYMAVEILMGLLFAFAAYHFHSFTLTAFAAAFIFIMVVLFWIDLEHYILPDVITIPFLLTGLIIIIGLDLMQHSGKPFYTTGTFEGLIGAVAGFGFFYLVAVIGQIVYKKDAMGGGDIKLAAGLGMWLGWKLLIACLFMAFAIGAVVGLLMSSKLKDKQFPFGTTLAISGIVTLFFGEDIIVWYLGFLTHSVL